MRSNFDFAPLYRSSVGFDRVFDLLEDAQRGTTVDNWPPYDIVKTGEDDYRITLAIAGFASEELAITQEQNMLFVAGQKSDEDAGTYLYRGIASRAFQRRFELADHVKVVGAALDNGLLTIDLKREVPEAMKPRSIEITRAAAPSKSQPQQVETQKKAA